MFEAQNELASKKHLSQIFADIPPHYDLINCLVTWGMDQKWRKKAAETCLSSQPQKVLDLCCGTGDLGVTIANLADYRVEIKGLDFSQPMLDIAARKASQVKGKKIAFTQGDAAKLPFPGDDFDCIGISFAFRNLTYNNPLANHYLSEILRVLKPGGKFVIVESSQPGQKMIRAIYHFYMRQYVYRVGSLLSGNKAAYRYLAESSSRYYSPAELKEFLVKRGFKTVSYQPLFFGAAGIYVARK